MLRFNVQDHKYKLYFQYPRKHSKKNLIIRCIIREVLSTPDGTITLGGSVIGEAKCNIKAGDKFDKNEGRMLAMNRALIGPGGLSKPNFPRAARIEAGSAG